MTAAGRRPSPIARTASAFFAGVFLLCAAPDCARSQPKVSPRPAPAQKANPAGPAAQPKPKPPSKTPPAPANNVPPAPAPDVLEPQPPLDTSTPPPALPRASREKMRACAEEWEKMKRATKVHLPMWRDFATGCLTR